MPLQLKAQEATGHAFQHAFNGLRQLILQLIVFQGLWCQMWSWTFVAFRAYLKKKRQHSVIISVIFIGWTAQYFIMISTLKHVLGFVPWIKEDVTLCKCAHISFSLLWFHSCWHGSWYFLMFFDKHKHNPSILHMFPQCFFGLKELNQEGEFLKWIKTFQSICGMSRSFLNWKGHTETYKVH